MHVVEEKTEDQNVSVEDQQASASTIERERGWARVDHQH